MKWIKVADLVRHQIRGPSIKFLTHEMVIHELSEDEHSWHVVVHNYDTDSNYRFVLWCQWCGALVEHVGITVPETPGGMFQYRRPGDPGVPMSKKPTCVVRTYPPPGLKINYKDRG